MSREWTIGIRPPAPWLNSNDRPKRRPDAAIAAWRGLASALAQKAGIPRLEACHLTATLRWPDRRRRDSPNYMPTVKAAVDGIVTAGVIDDDDDLHVLSLTIQRGEQLDTRGFSYPGWLDLTIREAS